MKFKLTLITLFSVLCLTISNVYAQTASTTFTASHIQAAEKYLIATNIDTQFSGMIDNMITASSAQIPEAKRPEFIKVMKTFMDKYYSWAVLKDKYAAIYASEYSEAELKQLTVFYSSPLGKKVSSKTPVLLQKGMALGQEVVASHRTELEQMMKDAFENKEAPAKQ
jgi:hypothetical protein